MESKQAQALFPAVAKQKVPVILDSDIGTDVDDTIALLVAANHPSLHLCLFLSANELECKRATMAQHVINTFMPPRQSPVKVVAGKNLGIKKLWIDDALIGPPRPPQTLTQFDDPMKAVRDVVSEQTHTRVRYVCIGGMSNLAELLRVDPALVQAMDVYIMGGSIDIVREKAEFNFRLNPTDTVFCIHKMIEHNIPIRLVPLDVTMHPELAVEMEGRLMQALRQHQPALHQYVHNHFKSFIEWSHYSTFSLHDPLTVCASELCSWSVRRLLVGEDGRLTEDQDFGARFLIANRLTDAEAAAFMSFTIELCTNTNAVPVSPPPPAFPHLAFVTQPLQPLNTRPGTNQPELRHRVLFETLHGQVGRVYIHAESMTAKEMAGLRIHSAELIAFLETAYASWEKAGRDADFYSEELKGLVPYHFTRRLRWQSYQHLPVWKQLGWFVDDVLTPLQRNTFEVVSIGVNAASKCVDALRTHRLVFCAPVHPGHHAMTDGFGGYCFLNNAAVIARSYQKAHTSSDKHTPTVCILDIDYHHGNGTQDIFYDDPSVVTASLHADPRMEYPSYSGFRDERGCGAGLGSVYNYPLPARTDGTLYLKTLSEAIEAVKGGQQSPVGLVVVAFGCDTVKGDPDASKLGGFDLDLGTYAAAGELIARAFPHVVVVQEGGYDLTQASRCVLSLLTGLHRHMPSAL